MTEMTDTDAGAPSAVDVDPIEDRLRRNIRATIEALFEAELEAFLGRCRYGRRSGAAVATVTAGASAGPGRRRP